MLEIEENWFRGSEFALIQWHLLFLLRPSLLSVWSAVPDRISLPTPLLRAFNEVNSIVI